jgi:hypothetical protein
MTCRSIIWTLSLPVLNGELVEEVYVSQPPGFMTRGKEGMVFRLHKALYGLRQPPRGTPN